MISFKTISFDLSDEYSQLFQYTLSNGEQVEFEFVYRPRINTWFINRLTYKDYNIYNIKLVKSDNLISQYINLFPFAIYCTGRPMMDYDLKNKNVKIGVIEF